MMNQNQHLLVVLQDFSEREIKNFLSWQTKEFLNSFVCYL